MIKRGALSSVAVKPGETFIANNSMVEFGQGREEMQAENTKIY